MNGRLFRDSDAFAAKMGRTQQRYVRFRGAVQASAGPLFDLCVSQSPVCEMSGKPGFLGVFLYINPYPILCNTNGFAFDYVPLGQTSLPNTS